MEKLIFPVGSAGEIQHTVRAAAAVDDHHALVIGLSGFGRIAFSRHVQAVKQNAFDRRSHFEAKGQLGVVAICTAGELLDHNRFLAGGIE